MGVSADLDLNTRQTSPTENGKFNKGSDLIILLAKYSVMDHYRCSTTKIVLIVLLEDFDVIKIFFLVFSLYPLLRIQFSVTYVCLFHTLMQA